MKRYLYLLFLALTACGGGKAVAPVGQYESRSSQRTPTAPLDAPLSYSVKRGDTLYSISFRYGMDWRELARVNGIRSPYTIYVGQKLKFRGAPPAQRTASVSKPVASSVPSNKPSVASPKPVQKTPPSPATTVAPKPAVKPEPATQPRPSSSPMPTGSGNPSWRWPTAGPLLSSFSNTSATRKGIKIAGKAGQDVVAAANGRVVYSGDGLPRYGNLLIVKHNDVYLSAYAHNQTLLVKEGDSVQAGQKIATLGRTGTQRDQLHFEIRRNGQPVDPMRYLPKQ
ncbi:Lipoprotein NlpD [Methylophaga frappieri]|uniref:Lipoprotein NlpD n=1 Tax=Methylophaga frappieri (strain ATCC BAA-2434 / DSM 25690 / JAM7) TaxID=754477 RepID=I1YHY3_METFJ|nr:peptidoglycan DD-metalloendopeptidase family protein [Methylophaga frappieri]AFJ02526.1 Lipoprotein NlpD [Methylophaga frappieri]